MNTICKRYQKEERSTNTLSIRDKRKEAGWWPPNKSCDSLVSFFFSHRSHARQKGTSERGGGGVAAGGRGYITKGVK